MIESGYCLKPGYYVNGELIQAYASLCHAKMKNFIALMYFWPKLLNYKDGRAKLVCDALFIFDTAT